MMPPDEIREPAEKADEMIGNEVASLIPRPARPFRLPARSLPAVHGA
jgi:hypothetical protein